MLLLLTSLSRGLYCGSSSGVSLGTGQAGAASSAVTRRSLMAADLDTGLGMEGRRGPAYILHPVSCVCLELPKPVRLLLCLPTRPCVSNVSMFRREDDNFHPLLVTFDLLPRSHWSKYKFGTCIEDIQTSELEKWLTNLLPFVSVFPRSLLSAKQTYIS